METVGERVINYFSPVNDKVPERLKKLGGRVMKLSTRYGPVGAITMAAIPPVAAYDGIQKIRGKDLTPVNELWGIRHIGQLYKKFEEQVRTGIEAGQNERQEEKWGEHRADNFGWPGSVI